MELCKIYGEERKNNEQLYKNIEKNDIDIVQIVELFLILMLNNECYIISVKKCYIIG